MTKNSHKKQIVRKFRRSASERVSGAVLSAQRRGNELTQEYASASRETSTDTASIGSSELLEHEKLLVARERASRAIDEHYNKRKKIRADIEKLVASM